MSSCTSPKQKHDTRCFVPGCDVATWHVAWLPLALTPTVRVQKRRPEESQAILRMLSKVRDAPYTSATIGGALTLAGDVVRTKLRPGGWPSPPSPA